MENDWDSPNHENLHDSSEIVHYSRFFRFMRIHEDSPMIRIESHSCVHGVSKQTNNITILTLELRRCLVTTVSLGYVHFFERRKQGQQD